MPTQSIGREVLHHNRHQRRWKEVPKRTKVSEEVDLLYIETIPVRIQKASAIFLIQSFLNYEGDIIIYI